jgi:DNA polymerase (family 10)
LLEIEEANPYRVRAYRNAGCIIDGLSLSLVGALQEGKDLTAISNIGEDLADKIKTIVERGRR